MGPGKGEALLDDLGEGTKRYSTTQPILASELNMFE